MGVLVVCFETNLKPQQKFCERFGGKNQPPERFKENQPTRYFGAF